jgi:hypothetical protein
MTRLTAAGGPSRALLAVKKGFCVVNQLAPLAGFVGNDNGFRMVNQLAIER